MASRNAMLVCFIVAAISAVCVKGDDMMGMGMGMMEMAPAPAPMAMASAGLNVAVSKIVVVFSVFFSVFALFARH